MTKTAIATAAIISAAEHAVLNIYRENYVERTIGALGEIPFVVGHKKVQTVSSFQWEESAEIAEHKIIRGPALTEATGEEAGKIEIGMQLVRELGADPMELIAQALGYKRRFTPVALVIGDHTFGRYLWLVKNVKVEAKVFAPSGRLDSADVSISLVEYVKGGIDSGITSRQPGRVAGTVRA